MDLSHAQFAIALDERLRAAATGGNLVWSPYSVASALGLAAAGARGRTRDELARVLAPGADLAELGRMLTGAAALSGAEAAVVNTLWADLHLHFHEDYQQTVQGWPGGTVRTANFRDDPDGSRVKINDDVAQTTRGLIQDLLAQGTITVETAAVIVNALYLKVAWRQPFQASATAPAPFHARSGTRQVPTMRQHETLRYAAARGWRMVTLPTASEVVVDLLLPDQPDQPPDARTLVALQRAGRMTKVDLAVPRFRVETAAMLNPHLRQLGVAAAFIRGEADFSAIAAEEIFIDTVVHKAVLRVDEQGFEGAAATAVVMRLAAMDLGRPVPFHLDRPFLLVVRHQPTGACYFLAHVAEP